MQTEFIAEPIMSIDERLMGVELLTRFISSEGRSHHPEYVISSWDLDRKRLFLYEQCAFIASKQKWFESNSLFCTLNIDQQMAFLVRHDHTLIKAFESVPFVKLELSEHFPDLDKGLKSPLLKSLSQGVNGLWLDDLGAGNANVVSLMVLLFEGGYPVLARVAKQKKLPYPHVNAQGEIEADAEWWSTMQYAG